MVEHESIKVVLRCRTRSKRENDVSSPSVVTLDTKGPQVTISIPESRQRRSLGTQQEDKETNTSSGELVLNQANTINKSYKLDQVFGAGEDQLNIFNKVAEDMCDEFLRGYNCTIFAYGQTGSGKTYTMFGDISSNDRLSNKSGIIPRCLERLFERSKGEIIWKCSFVEIYNEELRDLLGGGAETDRNLRIYEQDKLIKIKGLEEIIIKDSKQALKYLKHGLNKRETQATKMNLYSSRSHTIFTIHMIKKVHGGKDYQLAKFNLVDLAGAENIRKSGSLNQRAKEAGSINQSLLTLGKVINSLSDKNKFVPYRESKLTRLLKDSLGGDTKTTLIATISPTLLDLHSTLSTLDYAAKAKNIQNSVQIGAIIKDQMIMNDLVEENRRLQLDLLATRRRDGHIYLDIDNYTESIMANKILKSQVDELTLSNSTLDNRMNELDEKYQKEKKIWLSSIKQMETQIISLTNRCNEQLQIEDQLRLKNTNLGYDVLKDLTEIQKTQTENKVNHQNTLSNELMSIKEKLTKFENGTRFELVETRINDIETLVNELNENLDVLRNKNDESILFQDKINEIMKSIKNLSPEISNSEEKVKDLINDIHLQTERLRQSNLSYESKRFKEDIQREMLPKIEQFQNGINKKLRDFINSIFENTYQSTQSHYSELVSKSYINSQHFNNDITKKLNNHLSKIEFINRESHENEKCNTSLKGILSQLSFTEDPKLIEIMKAILIKEEEKLNNILSYNNANSKEVEVFSNEILNSMKDLETTDLKLIDFEDLKTKITNLLLDKGITNSGSSSPLKLRPSGDFESKRLRSRSSSRSPVRSPARSVSPNKIKRQKID